MAKDERRVKVLWLPAGPVFELIRQRVNPGDRIRLGRFEGVPDDARLLDCTCSWERNAIGFLIEHESFDPVPIGSEPQWLPASLAIQEFRLAPRDWSPEAEH